MSCCSVASRLPLQHQQPLPPTVPSLSLKQALAAQRARGCLPPSPLALLPSSPADDPSQASPPRPRTKAPLFAPPLPRTLPARLLALPGPPLVRSPAPPHPPTKARPCSDAGHPLLLPPPPQPVVARPSSFQPAAPTSTHQQPATEMPPPLPLPSPVRLAPPLPPSHPAPPAAWMDGLSRRDVELGTERMRSCVPLPPPSSWVAAGEGWACGLAGLVALLARVGPSEPSLALALLASFPQPIKPTHR